MKTIPYSTDERASAYGAAAELVVRSKLTSRFDVTAQKGFEKAPSCTSGLWFAMKERLTDYALGYSDVNSSWVNVNQCRFFLREEESFSYSDLAAELQNCGKMSILIREHSLPNRKHHTPVRFDSRIEDLLRKSVRIHVFDGGSQTEHEDRQGIFDERNRILDQLDEFGDELDPLLTARLAVLDAKVDAFRRRDHERDSSHSGHALVADREIADQELLKVLDEIIQHLQTCDDQANTSP